MQLETAKDALTDQLAAPTTRRKIVKTGIKLGYAIPLVAATYKLTASGALAACGGVNPISFTFQGINLCCGCCNVGPGGVQNPILDALNECQDLLAAGAQGTPPTQCPNIGEPGSDTRRVCITFNVT